MKKKMFANVPAQRLNGVFKKFVAQYICFVSYRLTS